MSPRRVHGLNPRSVHGLPCVESTPSPRKSTVSPRLRPQESTVHTTIRVDWTRGLDWKPSPHTRDAAMVDVKP
jgi:hypothetical protein